MIDFLDEKNIFIQPGGFYFGNKDERVTTLLGSCIAITLWHPEKRIGGMCHYLLSTPKFRSEPDQLDGKYAEDAMVMFMREIKAVDTVASEYQAKVFGGGNMIHGKDAHVQQCVPNYKKCIESYECKNVACKNRLVAKHLLSKYGFNVVNHDVGGNQYRKIIFEINSGDVWLRRGE